MSEVRSPSFLCCLELTVYSNAECIVFTHDYHTSISFWSGLRVQPILADEVQTFKALITVHKVIQEGHPIVRSRVIPFSDCRIDGLRVHRLSRRLTGRHHGWKHAQERREWRAGEVRHVMIYCMAYD